ncbi:MAG: prepilin-type N-terminal cleavage/methylation domain-containing protein [Planctomycetes bacterium]|nr:prepilin-type N-terminal cleavage/methylation domain-containing protein [Planctomycetota bacterium]
MIRRPHARPPRLARRGATLLEVLIGFMILGIGALSVYTLFPFSALIVSFAMRDDRTTTCAITADGLLRDSHRRYVVEPGEGATAEPYHWLMDNPMNGAYSPAGAVTGNPALPALSTTDDGPSYPVFLDPMGMAAGRRAVGDFGGARLARVNLRMVLEQPVALHAPLAQRLCSQMDGLSFDENGNVPVGLDVREMRYNYGWVLQRPVNRDRFTVRTQVVVYDRRAHLYAPPGSEAVASARFVVGETTITNVPISMELRKGSWVLDAGSPEGGLRHGEFYRVVSLIDNGSSYTLEVHKPITSPHLLAANATYTGRLVSIPAVVDVYERPLLTAGTR